MYPLPKLWSFDSISPYRLDVPEGWRVDVFGCFLILMIPRYANLRGTLTATQDSDSLTREMFNSHTDVTGNSLIIRCLSPELP